MMANQSFNHLAYSEYMDDMNYSQGFYVTKRDDGWRMVGAVMRVDDSEDDRFVKAERAAMFAVSEHNKAVGKEGVLRFLKIVNLNVEPTAGALYYITASMENAAGEGCLYQLKIWETIKHVYKVRKFQLAPYWIKPSEKSEISDCRLTINNLMPWMDENYLYYKCFLASHLIRGIEVVEGNKANLWVKKATEKENIVSKFGRRKMPKTDSFYSFDL